MHKHVRSYEPDSLLSCSWILCVARFLCSRFCRL